MHLSFLYLLVIRGNTEDGMNIAGDTADALNNIVNGVTKAAELVGNIAIASNDQAAAITHINMAVTQVSATVQNNSATSQESAASSEEMSSQAEILNDLVGKFNLKDSDTYNVDMIDSNLELEKVTKGKRDKEKNSKYKNNHAIILGSNELGKY